MSDSPASYQNILRQARRLPAKARRQLAESLLTAGSSDEQVVLISMRRLLPETQARFLELMERHNAGKLHAKERQELQGLVARYEELMLVNTETLLRATHPELFTASGGLRRTALERTLRQRSRTTKSTSQ